MSTAAEAVIEQVSQTETETPPETQAPPETVTEQTPTQTTTTTPTPPPVPRTVPLEALHEAREQVKSLRAQIAAIEAQPKLTAEDAELLKSLRAQQTQEPAPPDFLSDPKGYVDARLQTALKKLETAETGIAQTREQVQQQNQMRDLLSSVAAHEQTFIATTPDYTQALAHVRAVRSEQLKLMYPTASAAQIQQQIAQEEIGGSAQALQAGLNPAEVVYKFAKTVGYAPKATNGAQGAQPQPPQPPPDRSSARSLGGAAGGAAGVVDAAETEDTMPEFSAALKERFGVKRR